MMEAARASETSVDIQLRTRQYIPEDSELHTILAVVSLPNIQPVRHLSKKVSVIQKQKQADISNRIPICQLVLTWRSAHNDVLLGFDAV
jgi:hypothetical protein